MGTIVLDVGKTLAKLSKSTGSGEVSIRCHAASSGGGGATAGTGATGGVEAAAAPALHLADRHALPMTSS